MCQTMTLVCNFFLQFSIQFPFQIATPFYMRQHLLITGITCFNYTCKIQVIQVIHVDEIPLVQPIIQPGSPTHYLFNFICLSFSPLLGCTGVWSQMVLDGLRWSQIILVHIGSLKVQINLMPVQFIQSYKSDGWDGQMG